MSSENENVGLMGGAGPSEIAEHLKELAQKYRVNKTDSRIIFGELLKRQIIREYKIYFLSIPKQFITSNPRIKYTKK